MIKVIRNAIPADLCRSHVISMDLLRAALGNPPDPTISNAFGYYSPIFLESLLLQMQQRIERETQKTLHPTYSYGRIYEYCSQLKRHTDRPSSEWAVSCCLEKDTEWSLCFKDGDETVKVDLNVGDICIYNGMKYEHWRNAYSGKRHVQAMLMYVDADGDYSEWKLDKRDMLCHPNVCPPD